MPVAEYTGWHFEPDKTEAVANATASVARAPGMGVNLAVKDRWNAAVGNDRQIYRKGA